jgi:hypothetical protein
MENGLKIIHLQAGLTERTHAAVCVSALVLFDQCVRYLLQDAAGGRRYRALYTMP